MPKVKSSKRSKTRGATYSEEHLQKALEEIKRGIPKKTVSKKFGIPRSTLQFRLSNKFTKIRHGPNTYLTKEEEETLVLWIKDSHRKGFPCRRDDILASVKKFLDENPRDTPFKNNTPGKHWYQSFLGRHTTLSSRTPEAVTNASANVSESDIRKWFTDIEEYLREKNYLEILEDPDRVFNGDETCFQLCPKSGKVLAPKGSKNVYEIDQGQAKANITVMFTFAGSGKVTPPMVIYPHKRLPAEIAEHFPKVWGLGISDNGWMKSELFFEYVANILYPFLQKSNTKFPIILFVDGHKTHLTYQVSQLCSQKQIILIALYPNATRILQPADVSCFRPLKSYWKKGIIQWRQSNPLCQVTKTEFASILEKTLEKLTPEIISNGFKACGLCPWNMDAIDFSKCLGKGKKQNILQEQTVEEETIKLNLNFDNFVNIISVPKFEQLKAISMEELQSTPEDFQILYKLLQYFGTQEDVVDKTVCVEVYNNFENIEPSNTFDFPLDIIDNLNDNNENENVFTEQEIMEMPVVLDNDRANLNSSLNDNIRDYLLWHRTPERTGKRQVERMPYVITSTAFKNICEEKEQIKNEILKQKAEKQAKKDEKKLQNSIKNAQKKKGTNKNKTKCENKNVQKKKGTSKSKSETNGQLETDRADGKIKVLQNIVLNDKIEVRDEVHVRKLFTDEEPTLEDINGDEESTLEDIKGDSIEENICISKGLCYICVSNLYGTNPGIKCKNCTRTYHLSCLKKKNMYKSNFLCLTCSKK